MSVQLDPVSYIRFPKLDVAGAIGLAKILLHRVPKSSTAGVRQAVEVVEETVEALEAKWTQQVVPVTRHDLRPLAGRVRAAWKAIRDRLGGFEALPESHPDRGRALLIRDTLFAEGLEFNLTTFVRHYGESERRLRLLDERGLAKDLARLVGDYFLKMLRTAQQAYGDALGMTKAAPPQVAIVLTEPLRAVAEAITAYALQMLAMAGQDPDKREAVALALSPIDEFRASLGRRVVADDDDDENEVDADVDPVIVADDDVDDADDDVVTPMPVLAPAIPLAPVA